MKPGLGRCLALLAAVGACAKIEPPPGGPPDSREPVLIGVSPESLAVGPRFSGPVRFQFDEVIFEGSQPSMGLGTSDLERLVLLSPTTEVPRVRWKRDAIEVEPREGWRPNRIYRIELLPGVMDLRRNRSDTSVVITLSTGAPAPADTLRGTVVDWSAGRLARLALVEALLLPDSLPYRSLTDSSGRFVLGPIPTGSYLVSAALDQNRNFRREFREAWDTVRVRSDSGGTGVLWTAVRDTVGPRLQSVSRRDSLTAELTFNQPLDPYQSLDTSNVRVFAAREDSALIRVVTLRSKALDDSLEAEQRRPADTTQVDTTRAAGDTAAAQAAARIQERTRGDSLERALLATRPPLSDRLVLRTADPLLPGARYVIEVLGIRNVNRVPADSRNLLTVPEPPPPPPADSLAPADSTPADSTAPAPTPTPP